MNAVVVDASVLIAALMADGRTRQVLLHTEGPVFVAPQLLAEEALAAIPKVARRAGVPATVARAALRSALRRIVIVPGERLAPVLEEARLRARAAGAEDDAAYVALALLLDAPVWTLDKDFGRIDGVRVVTTDGVARLDAAR